MEIHIEHKKLQVIALVYPNVEYKLGFSASVVDEGAFYRIDGMHIFDKLTIIEIRENEGRVEIVMRDRMVILEVKR